MRLPCQGIEHAAAFPENWIVYADIARQKGDLELASQRYSACRDVFPYYAPAYSGSAYVEMDRGLFGEANRHCEVGIRNTPYAPDAYIAHTELALRRADHKSARVRAELVREKFPLLPYGYTRGSNILLHLHQHDESKELLASYPVKNPARAELIIAYGDYYGFQNKYEDAMPYWTELREKYPLHLLGYTNAISQLLAQGNVDAAAKICAEALLVFKEYDKCIKREIEYVQFQINERLTGNYLNTAMQLMKIYDEDPNILYNHKFYNGVFRLFNVYLKSPNLNKENITNDNIMLFIIFILLHSIRRYPSILHNIYCEFILYFTHDQFMECLKNSQIKYNFNNEILTLISRNTSREDKISSLYILIEKGETSLIRCTFLNSDLPSLYKEVINEIVAKKGYNNLSPTALYNFIRLYNFYYQDLTDDLLNNMNLKKCYNLSHPHGLLSYRLRSSAHLREKNKMLISNPGKKLKVAVCVSGQLRGFKECINPLIHTFDLNQHDTDFYVHTWENIGRKFPNVAHARRTFTGKFLDAFIYVMANKNVYMEIENSYPNLFNLLMYQDKVTIDELRYLYKTNNVILEDDTKEPLKYMSNMEKLYSKQNYVINMVKDYYDVIIWVRPDLQCDPVSKINLREIYDISRTHNHIFTTAGYFVFHAHGQDYGIFDVIAIGTQPIMQTYARAWSDRKKVFIPAYAYALPPWLQDHMTPAYHAFTNGIGVKKLHNFKYTIVDPEKLSIKIIYESLLRDTLNRELTYSDRLLIEAAKSDIDNYRETDLSC